MVYSEMDSAYEIGVKKAFGFSQLLGAILKTESQPLGACSLWTKIGGFQCDVTSCVNQKTFHYNILMSSIERASPNQ